LRLPDVPDPGEPSDGEPAIEDTYLSVDDTIQRENTARLDFIRSLAPPSSHPRLLEIGCMHGGFVVQAKQAGYEAYGLDISQRAVDWAAEHNPGLVGFGTLGPEQADASLDVVAGFNVVEHMDDPGKFLDHVARVLRPGGIFVAETPAQESLYHHVLFARAKVMPPERNHDVGMHPGTHIFKFGRRAWNNVLRRRSFEVLDMQAKSTPLLELLAKNRTRGLVFSAGVVGFGLAQRATGLGNRVLLAARAPA
jgi:2-polyprenyl-3-methyl-5-hydroxy-6-metoxy-1,4-benzoquinol methylase